MRDKKLSEYTERDLAMFMLKVLAGFFTGIGLLVLIALLLG